MYWLLEGTPGQVSGASTRLLRLAPRRALAIDTQLSGEDLPSRRWVAVQVGGQPPVNVIVVTKTRLSWRDERKVPWSTKTVLTRRGASPRSARHARAGCGDESGPRLGGGRVRRWSQPGGS